MGDEAARQRDALRLAAGHLAGAVALHTLEVEPFEPAPRFMEGLVTVRATEQQRQRDVLLGGQLGHELAELEDEAEAITPQSGSARPPASCRGAGRRSRPRPESGTRMPARQWSSVDLPEPLGPITATISPRFTEKLAPRSAGVSPKESTRSRPSTITPSDLDRRRNRCPFMTPPPRRARASRAAVRSIQRRSASKWKRPWSARRASTRLPCCLSSVSSRIRRRCAARCDVEVLLRRAAEHEREHDLHEEVGLEVGLGRDGLGEPRLDLALPGLGDGVALAVRTGSRLSLARPWPFRPSPDGRGWRTPGRREDGRPRPK